MLGEYVTCTANALRIADEEIVFSDRRRVA
jgi:hypothetical protein